MRMMLLSGIPRRLTVRYLETGLSFNPRYDETMELSREVLTFLVCWQYAE
jgi:hypothetical protein